MKIKVWESGTVPVVEVESKEVLIKDISSAIDLFMSVSYETGCHRLILAKELISEEFFELSTKIAGEVLQKCINYHIKLAVYGDFGGYTSKSLRDFIYESNQGNDFFFVGSANEAAERLRNAS